MKLECKAAAFLLLLMLAIATPMLSAGTREFQVERVMLEKGVIPDVTCILQDRDGFMWMGTTSGLWRFDGLRTRFFKHDPANPVSLSSSRITALYQDKDGFIWVGTKEGLNILDTRYDEFERFLTSDEDSETISHNSIRDITSDRSGSVWIATDRGLNQWVADEGVFVRTGAMIDETGGNYRINTLGADEEGNLWMGTRMGLVRYDTSSKESYLYPLSGVPNGSIVDKLIVGGTGPTVLIDGRVYRFDTRKNRFKPRVFPEHHGFDWERVRIKNIFADSESGLWMATEAIGLLRYDTIEGDVVTFNHDPNDENTLSYNEINAFFQDRGGILWVGTPNGPNKIFPSRQNFIHEAFDPRKVKSLSSNTVHSFLQDSEGDLWIGTANGLNKKPRRRRGYNHYFHEIDDKDTILSNNIYGLIMDYDKRVWIGSKGGLNLYDRDSDTFKSYTRGIGDFKLSEVFTIGLDGKGRLWMGNERDDQGIQVMDPETGDIMYFEVDQDVGLPTNMVFEIQSDSHDRVWIGTLMGLAYYIPEENRFGLYTHNEDVNDSLPSDVISNVHEDADGNLWIGTMKSVAEFDRANDRFIHFGASKGLNITDVYGLTSDRSGFLWISHQQGITKYNPRNHTAVNYDFSDGLNNKYYWGSVYRSKKGQIYFGGVNGFNSFHPGKFQTNMHKPPVVFTEFRTQEGRLRGEDREFIQLPYTDSFLKINFAALDYTNPDKNLYSYRVEGQSDEWSPPSSDAFREFYGLDPGDYILHVRASNNDGVWNEEGAKVEIQIVPPWWRTRQANILYALLLPSMLYGFHRVRVGKLRARERELEGMVAERTAGLQQEKEKTEAQAKRLLELDKLKTQFFSNVSHEFRTPLTLIIGPLESMLGGGNSNPAQVQQHEVMLRNARRLLRLINQLLDVSKLEAGKMRLRTRLGNIHQFVKPVAYAFHSLASERDIKLEVRADREDEVYFDPEHMEKVLFNLLSNAFQYTPSGGEIYINISRTHRSGREVASLSVADTGKGIPEKELPYIFDRFRQADGSATREQEGTGIGLSLVKELITLHHGEILVDSKVGLGTNFTIYLPLGKNHLKPEQIAQGTVDNTSFVTETQIGVEMSNLNISRPVNQTEEPVHGLGETILIVDDHPDVRNYIRESFASGYRVIEAGDGEQGLDLVRKMKPHLIISDVMMPRMDGYEMCSLIKQDKKLNHIPIILLTAKASDDMKVEGLEIGADDYLSKPFNVRELQARVRNLLNIRSQERSMKAGLEMAHKAQVSMLPTSVPQINGLQIASLSQPAREVGGDYFDFIETKTGQLGVVIGDVSGKGLPAALYMTMTKGLVQAYAAKRDSPSNTLTRINSKFHGASAANIFISLIYGVIDIENRKMTFSSAGHNPMVLRSGGVTKVLRSHGLAIGLGNEEIFERIVKDEEVTFQPGDVLLLYTDGISEGMNEHNEVFGEDRMMAILARHEHDSAESIMSRIKAEYDAFVGDMEQFDDMTALIIKFPEVNSQTSTTT